MNKAKFSFVSLDLSYKLSIKQPLTDNELKLSFSKLSFREDI